MSRTKESPFYQPQFGKFKKDDRFRQTFRETLATYHEIGDMRDYCCYGDSCEISSDADSGKAEKISTCPYAEKMGCPFNFSAEDLDAYGTMTTYQEPIITYETSHTIHGFPFFKAGTFNGVTFTEEDLDKLVANFKKLKENVKPVLKFGHGAQKFLKGEGLPALGWIENVYRSGKTLFADVGNIPQKVYDLIKKKAYRRPSAEIYKNYEQEGVKHGPVLSAIALLGAEAPAIKTLPEIEELFNREGYSDVIALYNANVDFDIYEFNEPIIYGERLVSFLNNHIEEMMSDEMSRGEVISSMASAAGIAESTVSGILRGDITCPPRQRLEGFAKALKIDVADIISAAERDGCEYAQNMSESGEPPCQSFKALKLWHAGDLPQGGAEMSSKKADETVVTPEGNGTPSEQKDASAVAAPATPSEQKDASAVAAPATSADKTGFSEEQRQELESLRQKVTDYEAEIAEQEERSEEERKQRRLSEFSEFVSSRKKEGKILPVHEPKIFAIMTKLPGDEAEDELISLQEEGKPLQKVSPLKLFMEVIDSNPNLVNFAELSESTTPKDKDADLDKYAQKFLSEKERSRKLEIAETELARKAETLAMTAKISYAEALVQVSSELSVG